MRAIGSAKSNTRCLEAPARGDLLRLHRLSDVAVAQDRRTATVGAGCTLVSLAQQLAADGLQLYSAVEIGDLTAE